MGNPAEPIDTAAIRELHSGVTRMWGPGDLYVACAKCGSSLSLCLARKAADAIDSLRLERDQYRADFTDMRDGVGRFAGEGGYYELLAERDRLVAEHDLDMRGAVRNLLFVEVAELKAERDQLRAELDMAQGMGAKAAARAAEYLARAENAEEGLVWTTSQLEAANERLAAVAALHFKRQERGHEFCDADGHTWPCATHAALGSAGQPAPTAEVCGTCEHLKARHKFYETNLSLACTLPDCDCLSYRRATDSGED